MGEVETRQPEDAGLAALVPGLLGCGGGRVGRVSSVVRRMEDRYLVEGRRKGGDLRYEDRRIKRSPDIMNSKRQKLSTMVPPLSSKVIRKELRSWLIGKSWCCGVEEIFAKTMLLFRDEFPGFRI